MSWRSGNSCCCVGDMGDNEWTFITQEPLAGRAPDVTGLATAKDLGKGFSTGWLGRLQHLRPIIGRVINGSQLRLGGERRGLR